MGQYIRVKQNKITGIFCGPTPGKECIDVPADFCGLVGQDDREFDHKTWRLRPLADRVADGLVVVDERHKISGEDVVPKTALELIRDGAEPCPKGLKLQKVADSEDIELLPMSRSELVAAGHLTHREAYDLDVLDCRAARYAAYVAEADPLFFQTQRGEVKQETWLEKVSEIKARFPKPQAVLR